MGAKCQNGSKKVSILPPSPKCLILPSDAAEKISGLLRQVSKPKSFIGAPEKVTLDNVASSCLSICVDRSGSGFGGNW